MGVAIALAVAELLHQPRWRVADGERHRARAILGDKRARLAIGDIDGVALGRTGQIDHRFGQRELALRRAEPLVGFHRIERKAQRPRISQSDILSGHADHASADVKRVGAAVEHAAQPVQRGIGVAAANGLVQRRDLVVERLTPLVEAAQAASDRRFDECQVDRPPLRLIRGDGELFDQIDEPPSVAVGIADNGVAGRLLERGVRHRRGKRPIEQLLQVFGLQRFEHVYLGAREQGAVDLERRIFGCRADEGQQSAFDEGQERVLLRLVEAVHLVDEQDRMAPRLRQRRLGARDGIANVLDAGKHRGEGDEIGVERRRHQPRQGGLARARRAPEDHRVQLARRERDRQRLAPSEQMALPNHRFDRRRAQPLGQRRGRVGDDKKISRRRHRRPSAG